VIVARASFAQKDVVTLRLPLARDLWHMLLGWHTSAQLEIGARDGSRKAEGVFHVKHPTRTAMKTARKEKEGAADRANTLRIPNPCMKRHAGKVFSAKRF
jgi:hypothetical protein